MTNDCLASAMVAEKSLTHLFDALNDTLYPFVADNGWDTETKAAEDLLHSVEIARLRVTGFIEAFIARSERELVLPW